MVTPHITTEKGDFASVVLIPDDSKQAQHTAEALLTDARKVTNVRGIGGYTDLYRGKPLSVMALRIGRPSLTVYATELYSFYDVKRIVRVGAMGSLTADVSPDDVVIALGAHTDSSIVDDVVPGIHFSATASWNLLRATVEAVGDDPQIKVGTVASRGRFCGNPVKQTKRFAEIGILGVEMETAGLYTITAELGERTLATLTISNLPFDPGRGMTAEERESKFSKALSIATAAAVG